MSPLNATEDSPSEAMTISLDPVRKLRQLDCVTTNTANYASPELAPGRSSPTVPSSVLVASTPSTPSISKREYCTSEAGSPTKVQSPLRHSVSYRERPELPFPLPSQESVTTDPTKSPTESTSKMVLTGDKRSQTARQPWLSTSSNSQSTAQVTPTKSRNPSHASEMERPCSTKANTPTPTYASRFSFLSTAFKGLTSSPTTPRPVNDHDDLISLNIDQTLHSMTSPTDNAAFSPAAFKNLQMVATGLLHKFQDAYTQRTMELRELMTEQMAQVEEQGEADMKMQHLRMQLEGMAQKAAEQEEMMQALMGELAREKKIRMKQVHLASGGSSISEDLAAEEDQRRNRRKSGGTSRSDISYDTDEEGTEQASVFSTTSRSPTLATVMCDFGSLESPAHSPQTTPTSKASDLPPPTRTPRPTQPHMSAFQKLFKGLSVENSDALGPRSCQNCQGQDVSVAWDTVSLLKDENKGLKQRVGDLEGALEGALDVVSGVGQ